MQRNNNNIGFIPDERGNTYLHQLIAAQCSADEFNKSVESIPVKLRSKMARTVNNDGLLPIDLLSRSNLSSRDKECVANQLLIFSSVEHQCKDLSAKISIDQVAKKYNVPANTTDYESLEYVCEIINRVRTLNLKSSTHPTSNQLQLITKSKINNDITSMRGILYAIQGQAIESQELYEEKLDKFLKACVDVIKEKGVADCTEYAIVAWNEIRNDEKAKKTGIRRAVKMVDVSNKMHNGFNADHVLLLVDGRILCDAHGGKALPYNEEAIKKGLKGHRSFAPDYLQYFSQNKEFTDRCIESSVMFNPKFHLVEDNNIIAKPKKNQSMLSCFGLFAIATLATAIAVNYTINLSNP